MKRLLLLLLPLILTACIRVRIERVERRTETPTPEMLIVRRTYPTREPTNTPYIAPIVYTVTALAYLPTATPTIYVPRTYYAAPVEANTCIRIIGNVNGNSRIYHCPGWRDYDRIMVNPSEGDRYFCTEAEARSAGFRAAEYPHGACR